MNFLVSLRYLGIACGILAFFQNDSAIRAADMIIVALWLHAEATRGGLSGQTKPD